MVRVLSWGMALAMFVAGVTVVAVRLRAQGLPPQQQGLPGYPSQATVMVLNKRPDEAVPVSIEANRFGPLPVSVSSNVPTVAAAQRWEYRSLRATGRSQSARCAIRCHWRSPRPRRRRSSPA